MSGAHRTLGELKRQLRHHTANIHTRSYWFLFAQATENVDLAKLFPLGQNTMDKISPSVANIYDFCTDFTRPIYTALPFFLQCCNGLDLNLLWGPTHPHTGDGRYLTNYLAL